jgi:hypothetical protein
LFGLSSEAERIVKSCGAGLRPSRWAESGVSKKINVADRWQIAGLADRLPFGTGMPVNCYRSSVTTSQGPTLVIARIQHMRESNHSRAPDCDIAGDLRPALALLQEPMAWFGGRGLISCGQPRQSSDLRVSALPSALPNGGTRLERQVGSMSTVGTGKRKRK